MSRKKYIRFMIVTVCGIVLVLISLLVFSIKSNYTSEYVDTIGVITDIVGYSSDTSKNTVTVRYTIEGKVYNNSISYYEDGFRDGKNIKIAYSKEDPNIVIYVGDTYRIPIIISALGLLVTMVGVCNIVTAKTKGIGHRKNLIVQGRISEVVRVIDEITGDTKGYLAMAMATNPKTDKILEIRSNIMTSDELKSLNIQRNKEVSVNLDLINNTGEIIDFRNG